MKLRKVARNILRNNLKDLPFDEIFIKAGLFTYPFAVAFAIESQKLAKNPFIQIIDDTYFEALAMEIAPSNIRLSKIERQAIDAADLIVWFSPYEEPAPKMSIEQEIAIQIWEEKQENLCRKKKILWMTYPSKNVLQNTACSFNDLEMIFLSALTVPPKKIETIGLPLLRKMQKADQIKIQTGANYELLLDISDRKVEIEAGYFIPSDVELYLPAGEVYVAPQETGAEGTILFDHPTWRIHELVLEFNQGRIVDFHAKKGEEIFKRFLESATGKPDVIAEFAFGINPVCRPIGWFLIDEKALGTIHIAIGENRHIGGTNQSSLHKDFICKQASVFIDSNQVLLNGNLTEKTF
ncbi:MAG: aminopeptidase [Candidatus Hermodarchaeota archaeon]